MALMLATGRHTVTALIAIALLASFARLGYVAADALITEPFVILQTRVLTPIVRAGDALRVQYTIERRKFCMTTLAEFWVDRATGQAVFRDRVPGGYAPLGIKDTLVVVKPPALPPGLYSYRTAVESDCGLTAFSHVGPDAEFEVVP